MQKLEIFLKDKGIEFKIDKTTLNIFSEDTSLFKVKPKIVIFPRDKSEISTLLKFLHENQQDEDGVPYHLTSRSAGTDMGGGALSQYIILSFLKYFNKIISIDERNSEAVVEPGVYYRDFERETLKHDLLLPSYPASRELCALGGIVSNNSGGEKSLVYGKTENYVRELECVLANGEIVTFKPMTDGGLRRKLDSLDKNTLEYKIYKEVLALVENGENWQTIIKNKPDVTKNSAGYYLWNVKKDFLGQQLFDPSALIVGSQGTLAVITKITLKLIKPKKYSKMILIYLKSLEDLGSLRNISLKYHPESFESYDDHTFKVVMKFLPAFLKGIFKKNQHTKKYSTFKFILLILSFWREAWMLLTFGMPKLFIIAEFTGDDERSLEKTTKACEAELKMSVKNIKTRYIHTKFEAEKYWVMRRESFNLLRKKVRGMHTAPFVDDIIVKGEDLEIFLEELIPILDKYKLLYTIAGHVGDANLHIIPLMNFDSEAKKEDNIRIIKECGKEVYDLIHKFHGSITAEHNDGLIRTPYLYEMYDEQMLALFTKVKNIFDENRLFSPGRKIKIYEDWRKELDHNLEFVKFGKNI